MQHTILLARAGAAWDTLARWDTYKMASRGGAVTVEEDHLAQIRSLAANVLEVLATAPYTPAKVNAVAAWRCVLKTNSRVEVEARLRVAIDLTAHLLPQRLVGRLPAV